jgi:addiction module HigA family antidote
MSMHNPPHPGEVLKELYLDPLEITVTDAAKALNVTRKTLSAVINGRSGISSEMALRLSKALSTSPEVWINLQAKFDLWNAKQNLSVKDVKLLRRAA